MKCLMKYQWVKLPRNCMPEGKGIMGAWAKLASRAAFRKGHASYCGHINAVSPGMWSGGVVGLKSILGLRSRVQALETLERLSQLGFVEYDLNKKTKKLTYQITDWVVKCSGEECMDGAVCTNYPECDAYVRVHAGTNIPVGSLANHELRTLRRTAHHYFDQLHQSGYMSKQDAYQWLADLIAAPLSEAHIGHLGEYYCKRVIEESRKILDRARKNQRGPRFQVIQGGAYAS